MSLQLLCLQLISREICNYLSSATHHLLFNDTIPKELQDKIFLRVSKILDMAPTIPLNAQRVLDWLRKNATLQQVYLNENFYHIFRQHLSVFEKTSDRLIYLENVGSENSPISNLRDFPERSNFYVNKCFLANNAMHDLIESLINNQIGQLHLNTLSIDQNLANNLIDALRVNQSLTHLSIRECNLNPGQYKQVLEATISHPSMTSLEIFAIYETKKHLDLIDCLKEIIRENHTIRHLAIMISPFLLLPYEQLIEDLNGRETPLHLEIQDPVDSTILNAFQSITNEKIKVSF